MGLLGKEELGLLPVDGVWERLDKIEFGTIEHFGNRLTDVGFVFRDAYDVGYLVPRLKPVRPAVLDLSLAALFLKRVLNDLRVVWQLLISGYTSQAASVAASLYESALACICLTLIPTTLIKWYNGWRGSVCLIQQPVENKGTDAKGVPPEALEFVAQDDFEFGQSGEHLVAESVLDLIPQALDRI